ncbi:hypothetical protein SmJEL517_g04014 [Synchytrium microbalum]|uniref:RING-type E3 ubiquitin transferase n=1 Tax=Synchytrium microbalum TaxID=1806994 RepID=A0A507C674_9FUNG|nr:uncharacterized protein SmJEL517_g04014 [Synchytrium microbalum]TPX32975.1 hypothetical protein SmJEL517_g04014 [Synchytrium microbalum]
MSKEQDGKTGKPVLDSAASSKDNESQQPDTTENKKSSTSDGTLLSTSNAPSEPNNDSNQQDVVEADNRNNQAEEEDVEVDEDDEDDEEDDVEDGEDDDEDGEWYCHSCQRTMTAILDSGTPTCPRCASDFVEEIEDMDDHPRGYRPNNNDENEDDEPVEPAAASAELARVLQLVLQQMYGNNANVSVATRPAQEGELPNNVIITTAAPDSDNATTSTTIQPIPDLAAPTPAEGEAPEGRPRNPRAPTTAAAAGGPETINLMTLLQALFEGPTDGQPNPLANILNMVGAPGTNPGDYVFGQRGLDDIITQLMEQHAAANAPPPAPEHTIKSLPRVTLDKDQVDGQTDCIVCQDEFKVGEGAVLLPCKHFFHSVCIESWLKVNGTCPICRYNLIENKAADSKPSSGPSSI